MADPRSIVAAPVAVARGLGFSDLAAIVAGDALVRRAWALGRGADLVVPTLTGDLSTQYAFDKELARDGQDRSSLGADELAARADAFEDERAAAAAQVLARLSVTADLGSAPTVCPEVALASRIAFVKLYEEGLVEEVARVVLTCPRCRTPVDVLDSERGELDGERLIIRLQASNGVDLDVVVFEPELLPGAVAVAVPEGSPGEGASVVVPVADREVPIIVGALQHGAGVVVAAHDAEGYALAQAHGLPPIPVVDADGTVLCDGPLKGLGRYAARAAARALLDGEGVLVSTDLVTEEVWRCRCCGSVLVLQLGRHWFLRAGDLEVAAADAVRQGVIAFSPPDARDAFLTRAGARSEWCIASRVPGGVPLPVSSCLDCGKVTVHVDAPSSCGKCMGVLAPEPFFLDARFVAAIWAVGLGGWPTGRARHVPEETVAVVSGPDLVGWVLPAVALGLRLTGTAPFAGAIAHPWPEATGADDAVFLEDRGTDPRVLRLALVAGMADLDVAAAAVACLDRPFADDIDAAEAAEAASAGVAALDACSPAQAASLLTSALTSGVPAAAAERLRALALPILGD